jgi:8-oxo-dGTP pyrophosphatase MutT (NUDIX family)
MDSIEQDTLSTPRTMITFNAHGTRFTYRVAGIILHNGCVLCQHAPEEHFWFLPGGRAELGESSEESIRREIREELGVEPHVERLLFVNENFFMFQGESHHELGLYFLMSLPPDAPMYRLEDTFTLEEETEHLLLTYHWLPVDSLETLPVYPVFLRKALRSLPEETKHIIEVEPEEA